MFVINFLVCLLMAPNVNASETNTTYHLRPGYCNMACNEGLTANGECNTECMTYYWEYDTYWEIATSTNPLDYWISSDCYYDWLNLGWTTAGD